MPLIDYHFEKANELHADYLRVCNSQKRIKAGLATFRFIDKDTNQYVLYMPSIDITSYGETIQKASEMLKSTVTDFLNYILQLPKRDQQLELAKLGWKQDKYKSKEYSKTLVDINGQLQNFNALDNKIEKFTLVA
jgi:hypothetical protein